MMMDHTLHDEFSDEENLNRDDYELSDHEMDNPELTKEEMKRANDPRYTYSFGHFPRQFRTVDEAQDTYNDLGYHNKI
jgi:hypothetical protein